MKDYGVDAGLVLAEKYRLTELLGVGGMGSVWVAEHLTLGSHVAVKVLKPHVASDDNSRMRFLREAKAAAAIRSPHVVQILDHGTHEDTVFIVMEKMIGEELGDRLKREKRLPPNVVYKIMNHIARALTLAHEMKIVHRDLKPANIFLIQNDDEFVAKVLDFGIAKSAMSLDSTDSPQTKTGVLLGTPYYVSPEQAQGTASVDHRADLWAMGVIAFECLCGRRPFIADSLVKLLFEICGSAPPVPSQVAQVPIGFDAWFAKALARHPDHRFQSAKELIASLKTVLVPAGISSATDMMTPLPGQFHAQQVAAGHLAHQSGGFAQSGAALLQSNPQSADTGMQMLAGSSPGTFDAMVRNTERSRRRVWGVVGTAAVLASAAVGVGVWTMQTSEGPADRSAASGNPRLEKPIAIPTPTASASSEATSEATSDPSTEPPTPSSATAEVPKVAPRAPAPRRPPPVRQPATNRRTPTRPAKPELDPFGI